jgi:hypothetical protein
MPPPPRSPTYPLAQVTVVAHLARIGRRVVERTRLYFPVENRRVEIFIRQTVALLKANEFVRSDLQNYQDRPSIMADIYGVRNKEGVWYVKFYVEHQDVTVLSCHEPERPLIRIDGVVIKAPT